MSLYPNKKNGYHPLLLVLILLISLTPLLYIPGMKYSDQVPKNIFLHLGILLSLVLILLYYKKYIGYWITINIVDVFYLLTPVTLLFLSIFIDQNSNTPVNVNILFYLAVFYILIKLCFLNKQEYKDKIEIFKIFLWGICISVAVEDAICILQFFEIIHYDGDIVFESVIIGTFGYTNGIAGFLAFVTPLLFGLLALVHSNLKKILIIIVLLINTSILILTKSRGSWVSLLIGLIVYYSDSILTFWNTINYKINKIFILAAILIFSIILSFFLFKMNTESGLGRLFVWKVSLQMAKEKPILGIGYGNYSIDYLKYQSIFFKNPKNSGYSDYATEIWFANNQYIDTLAETGILGFALFLGLILFFYRTYYKIKKSKNPIIARIIGSSITVILFYSLVSSPFFCISIYLLFSFCIAVLSSFDNSTPLFHFNLKKLDNIYIRSLFLIVFIIYGSFITIGLVRESVAYYYWKKAGIEIRKANFETGLNLYYKAAKILPNGKVNFDLGIIYILNAQYDDALREFQKAESSFRIKSLYLFKAKALLGLNRYDDAIKVYLQVLDMFPNLLEPRLELGKVFFELGEYDKASVILKQVKRIKPKIYNDKAKYIKKSADSLLTRIQEINARERP